ncbi:MULTISPECIES: hypothetical protein [unclassified Streptomyces]|uniref:hypothetical protein n=1 Tax=unclassified Streptomyces TaxID=2593676 RepID=UPI0035E2C5DC
MRTVRRDQVVVCSALGDHAVLQGQNLVGVGDGSQPVRDDEDKDRSVLEQGVGDGHSLALSPDSRAPSSPTLVSQPSGSSAIIRSSQNGVAAEASSAARRLGRRS